MSIVNVVWPKDENGNEFSIGEWIKTLSVIEQEEFNSSVLVHQKMVDDACQAGHVTLKADTVIWASNEIWNQYIEKYITKEILEIEQKFWLRYCEENKLNLDDILSVRN